MGSCLVIRGLGAEALTEGTIQSAELFPARVFALVPLATALHRDVRRRVVVTTDTMLSDVSVRVLGACSRCLQLPIGAAARLTRGTSGRKKKRIGVNDTSGE